jgi:hypothetical protein
MKKSIFLFSLIICGCANNKLYLLNETGKEKYFLSDTIAKVAVTKKIKKSPLLIVNLLPYNWKTKFSSDTIHLPIKMKNISAIYFLKIESAKKIYGKERGKNGVVLIQTDSIK